MSLTREQKDAIGSAAVALARSTFGTDARAAAVQAIKNFFPVEHLEPLIWAALCIWDAAWEEGRTTTTTKGTRMLPCGHRIAQLEGGDGGKPSTCRGCTKEGP